MRPDASASEVPQILRTTLRMASDLARHHSGAEAVSRRPCRRRKLDENRCDQRSRFIVKSKEESRSELKGLTPKQ